MPVLFTKRAKKDVWFEWNTGVVFSPRRMKFTVQLLIALNILAIAALVIIAPGLPEALALLVLTGVFIVVARRQGLKRAVIFFLKEIW
jgi:hypothetical protein